VIEQTSSGNDGIRKASRLTHHCAHPIECFGSPSASTASTRECSVQKECSTTSCALAIKRSKVPNLSALHILVDTLLARAQ
jgi:hypothetical protein